MNNNEQRRYLPSLADLTDRLSICLLKRIFIPSVKEAYDEEIKDIMHDIDLILRESPTAINAVSIKSLMMIMLSNRYIWENESKCRLGENQDYSLLKLTHSINGVRNIAKNVLSEEMGGRKDHKIDCLAAELKSEFQNWEVFKNEQS